MTIPNFITIARFLAVPAIAYALMNNAIVAAFSLFLAAGISDGIDGFIARHFNQRSELGAWLDPIADKLMLVTVFVMLGYMGHLPIWFVMLVVSRDVLIVAAVLLSVVMERPVAVRPIFVSKASTALQIVLVVAVMGELAFAVTVPGARAILVDAVAALTVVSGAAYLMQWMRHMTGSEA